MVKSVGLMLAVTIFSVGAAVAADPVGYVKVAEGEALVLTSGKAVLAQPGLAIRGRPSAENRQDKPVLA